MPFPPRDIIITEPAKIIRWVFTEYGDEKSEDHKDDHEKQKLLQIKFDEIIQRLAMRTGEATDWFLFTTDDGMGAYYTGLFSLDASDPKLKKDIEIIIEFNPVEQFNCCIIPYEIPVSETSVLENIVSEDIVSEEDISEEDISKNISKNIVKKFDDRARGQIDNIRMYNILGIWQWVKKDIRHMSYVVGEARSGNRRKSSIGSMGSPKLKPKTSPRRVKKSPFT